MRAALVFSLLLWASPAVADPTSEARTLFDAGQQAYGAGYYLEAARAFQQALELVPNPAITFSLAQCYRLQYFVDRRGEHLQRAVELYRRYLSEAPKGIAPRRLGLAPVGLGAAPGLGPPRAADRRAPGRDPADGQLPHPRGRGADR